MILGELGGFASAWLKGPADPSIVIPDCQLNCPTPKATFERNAVPRVTPNLMRQFGLEVPSRTWAGWD